ncbi:hypothetical protein [Desulfomonile tiedjei]|uniref:Uncharacterized protein n=1 Tax=Desulfomonile tiedjei (strain ATCC 49306 / DSM 6799 / DCB-1) TaxID=706587 RepID=I4C912_DESTA|nr:hypothetical protein [Desulfomonile tiedjei]AFM26053.1 hypothetical protein Desti_3399 [Desulfomonile tiedjei DSM 6799]
MIEALFKVISKIISVSPALGLLSAVGFILLAIAWAVVISGKSKKKEPKKVVDEPERHQDGRNTEINNARETGK